MMFKALFPSHVGGIHGNCSMPDLFDHALQERMKSATPLTVRMQPRVQLICGER